MRMLQRNFDGRDALRRRLRAGDQRHRRRARGGRPVDWFYYVNGIEAERRRGRAPSSPPATASGGTTTTGAPRCASRPSSARSPSRSCPASTGKRLPVRIDCARRRRRRLRRGRRRGSTTRASRSARPRSSARRRARRAARHRRPLGRRPPRPGRAPASRAARRPRACSRGRPPTGDRIDAARRRGERRRARSRAGAGLVAATRFARPGADLGRHRHRRRGRRRRGGRARGERAARPLRARGRDGPRAVPLPVQPEGGGAVIYRRRASPLHAARAARRLARGAWSLAAVALSFEHPLLLGALLLAVLLAARRARGVGGARRARAADRGCRSRSLIALVNALVVRDGLTVIAAARRPCRARRSSTSRSRRPPTARVLGAARAGRDRAASRCTPRPSIPTSCCARSGACRSAPR